MEMTPLRAIAVISFIVGILLIALQPVTLNLIPYENYIFGAIAFVIAVLCIIKEEY